jgi:hypothetical protein
MAHNFTQIPKALLRSSSWHFAKIFVFAHGAVENGHARDGPHSVCSHDNGKRFGRDEIGTWSTVQQMDSSGVPARPQTELDTVPRDNMHGRRLGSYSGTRTGS